MFVCREARKHQLKLLTSAVVYFSGISAFVRRKSILAMALEEEKWFTFVTLGDE